MNFTLEGTLSGEQPTAVVKDVYAGAVGSVKVGDLFIPDNSHAGYVRALANGEASTYAIRVYYCTKLSTDTVAANGVVHGVYAKEMILGGTVTTPANLAQAVIDTKVTMDLSGTTFTVDENDTSSGFMRIVRPDGGYLNFNTTTGAVKVIVNE